LIVAQNEKLAKTYGVTAYPCVVFMNAAGTAYKDRGGYREGGVAAWIKDADTILKRYTQK
jgi:hypothetical protein